MEEETMCTDHQLSVNVYCKNCECLLCPICAVSSDHKGHDYNLIDEIAAMERISIPQQVAALTKQIDEWHKGNGTLKEEDLKLEMEMIEKKRTELKNEIHNGIEKVKQQLDVRKEELLKDTEVICDKNSNIVKTILVFKNQTQELISTFKDIGQMSNFDMMRAKVTKHNQLSKDFNLIGKNCSGLRELSKLHNIQLQNLRSELSELLNIQLAKIGELVEEEAVLLLTEVMEQKVRDAGNNVASVGLSLDIPNEASIPHSVANTFKNLLAIAAGTEFSFPQAEKVKEYLEEKQEEEMGFGGLF